MIEHFLIGTYPRSRGENLQFLHHACAMSGSSPLTLGKLEGVHADLPDVRLIPAHAGRTEDTVGHLVTARAHPHSRGENRASGPSSQGISGSSPLTRGKRDGLVRGWRPVGLIPTHAGKTDHPQRSEATQRAHPHSRGENRPQPKQCHRPLGSSPLTRGKPGPRRALTDHEGLIPTHAGKTCPRLPRACGRGAHPHSRGENGCPARAAALQMGSSPLTRGKRRRRQFLGRASGIIPTHAGKTPTGRARPRRCRAHPRHAGKTHETPAKKGSSGAHPHSRGENVTVLPQQSAQPGSSPLTQGKHLVASARHAIEGLIPAHAGKTLLFVLRRMLTGVHPHSRGENALTSPWNGHTIGSSPLTRG